MIKYIGDMEWARPFVESARDLFPYERLKEIRGYRLPVSLEAQIDGQTHAYSNGTFSITIRRYYRKRYRPTKASGSRKKRKKQYKHAPVFLAELLQTLAHELAHTANAKTWDHTPDHLELELRIMRRFLTVVRQLGIKDTWHNVRKNERWGK